MKKRRRRSIRLAHYDYSRDGAYFITVCTKNRVQSLSRIENGRVELSDTGNTISCLWPAVLSERDGVELDEFIVMPNHIHGVIHIRRGLINQTPTAANSKSGWILMHNQTLTLGKIVRRLKAAATREIRRKGFDHFNWQRNYYDRVIRNERELKAIREYIVNNPLNWDLDRENPLSVNYDIDQDSYFRGIFA